VSYPPLPGMGPRPAAPPAWLTLLPVLGHELQRKSVWLALAFCVVALGLLAVGILVPKRFTSATTILVGEGNIIAPLMEGRAVPTSASDRARIAREVIYSRAVMQQILEVGGWADTVDDPLEAERIIEQIKGRTSINTPGANLIRIAYWDGDPARAFRVAQRFAELFIQNSLDAKERESREAYEFIAAQVEDYHRKLVDAETKLKRFRAENLEARPGSDVDVRTRVAEVRGRIEKARTELSELQMVERDLQEQLSGESEISDARRQSSQYQQRLVELSNELDRLRLDYTDAHPDVVRVRLQVEDMQQLVRREQEREALGARDDPTFNTSPLYLQLRSSLAKVRADMAAMRARISENEALLDEALDRGRRVADSEAELAELTRDYEVNRDLYQDLLKRRENARVSMSLDAQQRGLSFRVQEPAALPLQPAGLRLLHFAIAGLLLGVAVPVALLVALLQFDPRARSGKALAAASGLPLLGAVPEFRTRSDRSRTLLRQAAAAAIVLLTCGVYAVVALTRGGFPA
jgi:polysaccharide chain length determinant protein (PEP-CTERM system associated)